MKFDFLGKEQAPDLAGVYAFWFRKNGRCVYIGKAEKNLKKRLDNHWNNVSSNNKLQLWIKAFGHSSLDFCYKAVSFERIDVLERRLIHIWQPAANEQYK